MPCVCLRKNNMLLKKGITGFFDSSADVLAENDCSVFRKACYAMCSGNRELIEICRPDNTSYFYAWFKLNGESLYVLLNKFYPVTAFTNKLVINEKVFVDISENPLSSFGYETASAKLLNSCFSDTGHELSKGELQQIKYWNRGFQSI